MQGCAVSFNANQRAPNLIISMAMPMRMLMRGKLRGVLPIRPAT